MNVILLPFSLILNPWALISVFSEINFDCFLLSAVCSLLSNNTSVEKILNLEELNFTLFFNKISVLVRKLPSLAVTSIICFLLFRVNFGLIMSLVLNSSIFSEFVFLNLF